MAFATLINPKTGIRKVAQTEQDARILFGQDFVLEASPGVPVEPTSPNDPRLRDLSVPPPVTPQGTGGLPSGASGLTVDQATTPTATPDIPDTDFSKFGLQ